MSRMDPDIFESEAYRPRIDTERCIYKVPTSIRDVKPEAYKPRMVIIGLLNRSKKPTAAGTSSDPGLNNKPKNKYMMMEKQKELYLQSFKERVGADAIEEMKRIIGEEETNIRESYAESTDWVSRASFVDHILKDSIFIVEIIIRLRQNTYDVIVDNAKYTADVKQDLILLENQLPYFIFQKLFCSHMKTLGGDYKTTVDKFFLNFFSLRTEITHFSHFTDMFRCVYEKSLEKTPTLNNLRGGAIVNMENADYLSRVGVKFKTFNQLRSSERNRSHRHNQQPLESISIRRETDDDYSLHVEFKKGCLVMSSFRAAEDSESILRNVIAFEQCHPTVYPLTSNYINFLNFLITTERDVEVLTAEGVLNGMGNPRLVLEMVNSLNRGFKAPDNSQYHKIAMNLRAHYKSRRKRCWATLSRVYFPDLLTGTATCGALFLLFLTLVGTVASVIQAYKSFKDSPETKLKKP